MDANGLTNLAEVSGFTFDETSWLLNTRTRPHPHDHIPISLTILTIYKNTTQEHPEHPEHPRTIIQHSHRVIHHNAELDF